MATTLETVITPAAPSLPLGTQEYQRQYQDQLNNVLRLYFNQLATAVTVQTENSNTLQSEIDTLNNDIATLQAEIDNIVTTSNPLTLLWLGM
jgi:hypothetical protein